MIPLQIALIGNPNCGKTTLFNLLTGARQHVGNWPGVTVDKKSGYYSYQQKRIDVVDLPGTYAIESNESAISQDELVVRRFVLTEKDHLIVNIIDATNLQRSLYLTSQLIDLRRPMIVVLNMMDSVRDSGDVIDVAHLEIQLGCPVVAISASRNQGLEALQESILNHATSHAAPKPKMTTLGDKQEKIISDFVGALDKASALRLMNRWQLFDVLLNDEDKNSHAFSKADRQHLKTCQDQLAHEFGGAIDVALASSRYSAIDAVCRLVIQRPRQASKKLNDKIDRVVLDKIMGIPIFLAVMYCTFLLSINVGSAFIDFFDIFFGTLLVDGVSHFLNSIQTPGWLVAILANGLGGGIQTVSTFIPVIGAMFFCLSFLEDSGYLVRAAMVVDRGMRALGLPGKAFVPMLVGFGCNVPAIMGTRTLESTRDRLMSIMMIPYMSCGARLPVYALLVAAFFPFDGHNIVFGLYLGGIAVAILTGLVLKYTLLPGPATPFVMELPAYRMPTARSLVLLTWERLKGFMIRAGKVIVLVVMVLSFFNSLGTDGSFGNDNTDKSVLSQVGRTITPVFGPMGVQDKNWPATVGIFTGIFAKEAVIGTLNALYDQMGQTPATAAEGEETFDALAGIREAFATIPANLMAITSQIGDPLGIGSTLAEGDINTVAEDQGVTHRAIDQIHVAFGTTDAVIAFLIFVLLYTPCVAALGAVYREAGLRWTLLVGVWSFSLAWMFATLYYQLQNISAVPIVSVTWFVAITGILLLLFFMLRRYGASRQI